MESNQIRLELNFNGKIYYEGKYIGNLKKMGVDKIIKLLKEEATKDKKGAIRLQKKL